MPPLFLTCGLFAATTQTWEMNNYQDFLRGRISGLALTRDGRLKLGPKMDEVFASDQSEIWSLARAADGSLYAGTGNRGRLYKIDPAGKSSLVWTADQPIIFALAVDSKGVVYAGTSPDGKIYRIENGTATEYFAPKEHYIWALAVNPSGVLFAATGDQGKIYRVTASRARRASFMRPARPTSPASPSTTRAACWREVSPTEFCTRFLPTAKRSCCTMRIFPRSAPLSPRPMAASTRPHWAEAPSSA